MGEHGAALDNVVSKFEDDTIVPHPESRLAYGQDEDIRQVGWEKAYEAWSEDHDPDVTPSDEWVMDYLVENDQWSRLQENDHD